MLLKLRIKYFGARGLRASSTLHLAGDTNRHNRMHNPAAHMHTG